MIRVASRGAPANRFERVVLGAIAGFTRLDGVVTNNLLLPRPAWRNVPDEQDIVLLLPGRVVTLDMEELWPGGYRDAAGGWEYVGEGGPTLVEGLARPADVALKKAKVVEGFVRERTPKGGSVPTVLSCIVVPDACDVTELRADSGRTPLGARFYLLRLSELEDALLQDLADDPQRAPAPDALAALLDVDHLVRTNPYTCCLREGLRIQELLEERPRPIPRKVYLGVQPEIPRRSRVRVEVCAHDAGGETLRRMRAHRNHALALQDLRHPAVIALYEHHVTPQASLFVYEFFSRVVLEDALRDGPLAWSAAARIFRQLHSALSAAHALGIVHRYLDPTAVLLGGSELAEARVRDFFGSAAPDTSTLGQDPASTPYDPPERGPSAVASPAMDAWSLGQCLRFVLTADPFGTPRSGVPRELPAILHGLARSPADRLGAWRALGRLLGS